MEEYKIDTIGTILISCLLLCLILAGYISYKHIDFNVLQKIENHPLVLPTPIVSSPAISTPSAE